MYAGIWFEGTACYEESNALFRELNDRQGMINSMTYLAIRSRFTTEVIDVASLDQLTSPGETALEMARELDWRSAETAILSCLAQCHGSKGNYGHALELAQTALNIAIEIQHREWISGARWALGHLYHELFARSEAQVQLESALAMARDASSVLYIQDVSASLALAFISQHNFDQAKATLDSILDSNDVIETWGQRLCLCASAELSLAMGNPDRALQIIDHLITSAANIEAYGPRSIPRLSFLRAQALAGLDRLAEAEVEFVSSQELAHSQGRYPMLWRVQLELGKLYLAQGRDEAAGQEFSAACAVVDRLAATIPDEDLRENYLSKAIDLIPATSMRSFSQNKKNYSGLTRREREVAVLVSMGKSNREIAEELVVSERTAATHVSNILNKLNFSSRSQIAAWAVKKGLAAITSD